MRRSGDKGRETPNLPVGRTAGDPRERDKSYAFEPALLRGERILFEGMSSPVNMRLSGSKRCLGRIESPTLPQGLI
jgi:hypothetical protein